MRPRRAATGPLKADEVALGNVLPYAHDLTPTVFRQLSLQCILSGLDVGQLLAGLRPGIIEAVLGVDELRVELGKLSALGIKLFLESHKRLYGRGNFILAGL